MICTDLHSSLSQILAKYDLDQVVFVVDKKVTGEWQMGEWTNGYSLLPLASGEETKRLDTVAQIWDMLLATNITRRGLLVCIGGGVVTDLGGFAAATYKRGIDYINIPTTLLSMVDASTGGKTGCNYGGLKNAVGVFHLPVETLVWPQWLQSLPAREWLSGYAEMLKTGLIEQSELRLWDRLLQYDLDTLPIDSITPLVEACIAVKQRIVSADPMEQGLRKVLNFGHTFGHALEELSARAGLSQKSAVLPHGYAVLYGLIAELYLSVTLAGCPREPLLQLTSLMLRAYGRPQCNCSDRAQLIRLMRQDKKNEHAGEIICTLLRNIGQPLINQPITPEQADEAWDYLFSL